MTSKSRLDAQMAFLAEADRLKTVTRANHLLDQSRAENTAEHSWHAALAAMIWLPDATPEIQNRAIRKLILHDLVEIDAGDHPIHLDHDPAHIARSEARAADRLFGLLPDDLGREFRSTWTAFEAQETPQAKAVDYALPVLMVAAADTPPADHVTIARDNLSTGRARMVADHLPRLHAQLSHDLSLPGAPCATTMARNAFLAEADRLKSIHRATTLGDASRPENSAEHSWHLALYAMTLADHAGPDVSIDRVIRMLLLHDLVEIDAGDVPIYTQTPEIMAQSALKEAAAAKRLFGLLPHNEGAPLLALWQEFEAAETPDAQFAKALDRFQPPNQNLASGGVSWRAHNADFTMVEQRLAPTIQRAAPALWQWVAPQIHAFLVQ